MSEIKNKIKELAGESVIFSVAPEALNEFNSAVDSMQDNDESSAYLEKLSKLFMMEKENVSEKLNEVLG